MRIPEGIKKIKNYNFLKRTETKENNINKYFKINDNALSGKAFEQVYDAREIIANFAKNNDVKIDIFSSNSKEGGNTSNLKDKILVVVNNLQGNKTANRTITVDTERVYPKYNYARKTIAKNSFGEKKTALGRNYTEDTFLRHLYRCINELTQNITKKK